MSADRAGHSRPHAYFVDTQVSWALGTLCGDHHRDALGGTAADPVQEIVVQTGDTPGSEGFDQDPRVTLYAQLIQDPAVHAGDQFEQKDIRIYGVS